MPAWPRFRPIMALAWIESIVYVGCRYFFVENKFESTFVFTFTWVVFFKSYFYFLLK